MDRGRAGNDPERSTGSPDVERTPITDAAPRSAAFAEQVEPEIEILLRVARSLTGSWSDAEDLVQDTLLRAYQGIDRFDGAHPRAWLLTIMRRAHINTHRRRRPVTADPHTDLEHRTPAFGQSVAGSPEGVGVDQVIDDDLEEALAALDPRFRSVVWLVDVEQLSYQEAADVIGIPIGTVMSRLSRARSRLRKHLAGPQATRRRA
ncbi:MAG: RNA polymerase sigma factor [Flavobacterium sp.]|nr:RNA polymerase sigma factor [Aeromicrobium sp.]